MRLFDLIHSFFTVGISEDEYTKLKEDVSEENHNNLIFLSRILSVLMVPGTICVYLFSGGPKMKFWVYVSLMICLIVSFILAKRTGGGTKSKSMFYMYAFISILIGYSIVLSTILNPNMLAVKYIAFIMVLPMFFTDRPVRISLYIIACTAIFIISAFINDIPSILWMDIVHSVIFGTVSIVSSTYLTRIKIQRLYYEKKWKYISDTDLMTGMNSRNRYEQALSSYPNRCLKNLSCVFLDVNGLHEVDVEQGYEAGDEFLRKTASIFEQQFGRENSYRIGGDEFVAPIPDKNEKKIRESMEQIYKEIEDAGFSVSMGMADLKKNEIDMKKLIKMAADEMSDRKRKYYQNAEHDRRSR